MKPADTVFTRALDRFKNRSADEERRLDEYNRACARRLATEDLKDRGVVLIGHPSLIEYAVALESVRVAEAQKAKLEGKTVRKRGRPPVDPIAVDIYNAALALFLEDGVSIAAASKQAAKFLGEPATKDRIEKGHKRWLDTASDYLIFTNGSEITCEALTLQVFYLASELKRIAVELEADKAAEAARRKSARFAPFFGATDARKVASPK